MPLNSILKELIKSDYYNENHKAFKNLCEKGYNVVHKLEYMVVLQKKDNIIIWNLRLPYSSKKIKGHGHIKSIKMGKVICRNVVDNIFPKTRNIYLLITHIRVSDNEEYKSKIQDFVNIKKSKQRKVYVRN